MEVSGRKSDNPIYRKDCLSDLSKLTIAVDDFYMSIKDLEQAGATLKEESGTMGANSLYRVDQLLSLNIVQEKL